MMNDYGAFYEEQKEKLFSYLIRITGNYYLACDIMQESFTRYIEHYGQQQRNVSLLYAIARNMVVDNARKESRHTGLVGNETGNFDNVEQKIMISDEYRRVLDAMQKLEEEERDILALAVSADLTYREIASIVCTSEANVKVKVHRSRVKLRKLLHKGNV